jgi:hypothetical protein
LAKNDSNAKWGLEIRCYFNANENIPQQLLAVLEPRNFKIGMAISMKGELAPIVL